MASQIKYPVFFIFFIFLTFAYSESFRMLAYINPLKGDIGVHDPVMIQQESKYYIFYTGDYIPIKTSTDRTTWKESGTVFKTCPKWFTDYVPENDGKNCWAPDISFHDGKYWLYYSVSTFGKKVSAIGLATTPSLDQSSPGYKWTDEGMIIRSTNSNDYNCIDPNLFIDVDGKAWLSFGSWNTGIKMVEIDPRTGKMPAADPKVFSIAARKANKGGIEAPFIIRRDDYYYQFVSWDVCCKGVQSTYNIRIGRASKVTGPYSDTDNTAMNGGGGTLIDDGDERWIGPGHNGMFIENDTVFLVNHAYDAQKNGASILMIRPLYWNTNGWPSLDPSKGKPTGVAHVQQSPHRQPTARIQPVVISKNADRRSIPGHTLLFTFAGKKVSDNKNSRIVPGVYLSGITSNKRDDTITH